MNLRVFSKYLFFTVSFFFILFNNHLTRAEWQIETVDSGGDGWGAWFQLYFVGRE